jgi:hypothetical protein
LNDFEKFWPLPNVYQEKTMKLKLAIIVAIFTTSAFAWDCPAGQIRQQAPAGTPSTTPYYDVVQGIAFICVPAKPTDPSGPTLTNTNTNQTSVTATGGNSSSTSSATGGTATATGGNANQHQGQSQGQQQSSSSTSSNGPQSNTQESVYNQVRQAPAAYAPTILPTNCLGSLSGGASAPVGAISIGGTKRDRNCESIVLANMFAQLHNFQAAAKVLCSVDAARKAHLSLDECLAMEAQIEAANRPIPEPKPAPVEIQNVQAPPQIILINTEPVEVTPSPEQLREAGIIKAKPLVASHKPTHKAKPCVIPESLKTPMEK